MLLNTFHSSGNLIADRRFSYGQDLARDGEIQAACELYQQTLELVPDYAPAWFELGKAYTALNNSKAKAAFMRSLEIDPLDKLGAGLYLTTQMSSAYVTALFDSYASKFDAHLVGNLNYRGPKTLRLAVEKICHQHGRPCQFASVLDLGCGTGLSGSEFAPMTNQLIGCDLSSQMIEQARRKDIYSELLVEDAITCLTHHSADLILAVDVLVYMGDLQPLFAGIQQALKPHGLVALSLQQLDGDGFVLGRDMRYAHSVGYIKQVAYVNGLQVQHFEHISMRQDRGMDVAGLTVILNHFVPNILSPASPRPGTI